MNLFPQDLGGKRHIALICRRAWQPGLENEPPPTRLGRLGRLWSKKSGVDAASAAATVKVMKRPGLLLMALGLPSIPLFFAFLFGTLLEGQPEMLLFLLVAAAWALLCFQTAPRALFRKMHREMYRKPLSAAEIAALLPKADDELERAYLTLAMDVVRQELASGADQDLRSALRALGDAIDRLPATRVVSDSTDIMTEVLRRTAVEALQAAQTEPDRIVAASLVRRAEALQRRADATHRSSLLVRRLGALRQEMAAETEALRAGLSAYYTGANDIADLTRMAEDIRRVAAEATALTAARDEMDGMSADGSYVPDLKPETVEARLHLGRGGAG